MSFSLLSWNIENLIRGDSEPSDAAEHVLESNPDVFGLLEVKVNAMKVIEAFNELEAENADLDKYQFALTQGAESNEILVGVKQDRFEQTIFTQKRKFKVDNPRLRPGALVTLSEEGELYNVLFLHLKANSEKESFESREDMRDKIWSLRERLDELAGADPAHLVAMGDLNTVGLEEDGEETVTVSEEVDILREEAQDHKMRVVPKQFEATYCWFYRDRPDETSNLDHVLASDQVSLDTLGARNGKDYAVNVRGWNQLEGEERYEFILNVSDHSSLYCEVETR